MAKYLNEVIAEAYLNELQLALFPDNQFYKLSKMDGEDAIKTTTVHIPQQGDLPGVVLGDNIQLPLPLTRPEDSKKTYEIETFRTTPTLVENINQQITTYDKAAELAKSHASVLNTEIANYMADQWCPASVDSTIQDIYLTTGSARPSNGAIGLTNTRKAVSLEDFANVAQEFDRQDIPADEQRYVLVPATHMRDIRLLSEFVSYTDNKNHFSEFLNKGIVGEIYGFKILTRSKSIVYNVGTITDVSSVTKKAFKATVDAADSETSIFWHSDFVRHAESDAELFTDIKNPVYQGDIMSTIVRAGGTISRTDKKGLVVLVEDLGA